MKKLSIEEINKIRLKHDRDFYENFKNIPTVPFLYSYDSNEPIYDGNVDSTFNFYYGSSSDDNSTNFYFTYLYLQEFKAYFPFITVIHCKNNFYDNEYYYRYCFLYEVDCFLEKVKNKKITYNDIKSKLEKKEDLNMHKHFYKFKK